MFFIIPLIFVAVNAQTATVLNPAGQTVVQVVTLGADGLSTTSTLTTLTTSTTTAAATTTTTVPQQQGPVGQPAPTVGTPGGPTPFTYTTTVAGEMVVTTDVFTPSTPATTPFTPTAVGTIWDYSQWLSQYPAATTSTNNVAIAHPLNPSMLVLVLLFFIL